MNKNVIYVGVVALVLAIIFGGRLLSPGAARASVPSPAVSQPDRRTGAVAAEGRLVAYPDGEVNVGTEVAGTIVRFPVKEKSAVRKGELVVELRADDLRAALAEARARVAEAEADVRLGDQETARAGELLRYDVGTRQTLERAQRDRDAAEARRRTGLATVARLEADLAKTRILAPIDGVVIARHAELGETVSPGARLLTVADLSRTRIEAEVDEFDAGRIALGAAATVTAEGYDGASWHGVVEEIPDAVVTRRVRPPDPSQPVDTRVLLVKVALSEPSPLKLGQRTEIVIAPTVSR